jgi:hypothetical protein
MFVLSSQPFLSALYQVVPVPLVLAGGVVRFLPFVHLALLSQAILNISCSLDSFDSLFYVRAEKAQIFQIVEPSLCAAGPGSVCQIF